MGEGLFNFKFFFGFFFGCDDFLGIILDRSLEGRGWDGRGVQNEFDGVGMIIGFFFLLQFEDLFMMVVLQMDVVLFIVVLLIVFCCLVCGVCGK